MPRNLMFVGTASNVGKSILCTALCRILTQDGYRVAPFKSQNMSLNSAATPSGREIGRAQAVQAEACGLLPNEHMNPVLLKPTSSTMSQVVVQGKVFTNSTARDYFAGDKTVLWQAVEESYRYLAGRHDILVIEGAGSPVEMNLKARDIANMRVAELADAVVLLVADIDRGGVFASIIGTLQLLTAEERQRVKGIVINKFRGDESLFEDGRKLIESLAGAPVLGIIPYLRDIGIDEEDSVALDAPRYRLSPAEVKPAELEVAVVRFPHMANFTDFDPLFLEPGVHTWFAGSEEELGVADAIVLPGTKNTLADLAWMRETGLFAGVVNARKRGAYVFGICGGFQMLGESVRDPLGTESELGAAEGMKALDITTVLTREKQTLPVQGRLAESGGAVEGYEIHMGRTEYRNDAKPFAYLDEGTSKEARRDGAISADRRVQGTYLHGIFHNDDFRVAWLNQLRRDKGFPLQSSGVKMSALRQAAYDRLAQVVRRHLDMKTIMNLMKEVR